MRGLAKGTCVLGRVMATLRLRVSALTSSAFRAEEGRRGRTIHRLRRFEEREERSGLPEGPLRGRPEVSFQEAFWVKNAAVFVKLGRLFG